MQYFTIYLPFHEMNLTLKTAKREDQRMYLRHVGDFQHSDCFDLFLTEPLKLLTVQLSLSLVRSGCTVFPRIVVPTRIKVHLE